MSGYSADELYDFIVRRGYVRCDIPACNCGSFHRGHAEDRLREIGEALGDRTEGKTIYAAVVELLLEVEVCE